ncbi:transmembrane amino acid transporter protein, putative [Cryptosporidium muris RN66]|uniref:Transmembrane amino acid transporter protein, putative n=1 Tax=Cryptosporidium muris (strain RN66) TaxID=441375 RepID=B6AAV2_CRYMR|nr:transmembrane amino acid transporter protein, putative [Cryptosporidium muris RN66]EEA05504.1 transmembrane amino acid transporter protein, putative [Cryptosporidium muris RN66]|eukprot:XP_002139853.1 transmembrane amino acid transporter protein [Cryptosporidium muris RN66]
MLSPKTSLTSSLSTLLTSSVGIGCFYLPYMFRNNGLVIGITITLLSGALSVMSLKILAQATELTGAETYGTLIYYSYYDQINEGLFPSNGTRSKISLPRIFDILVFLDCFLCVSIFFIVLSELVPPLFTYMGGLSRNIFMFKSGVAIICLSSLLFFPICLSKRCYEWYGIAYMAFTAVTLCIFSILYYLFSGNNPISTSVVLFPSNIMNKSILYNSQLLFNICIFAYFSQFNIIPVVSRLYNPSPSRLRFLTASYGIILVITYSIMSACVYLMFGSKIYYFSLTNFADDDFVFTVCRFLIVISILFIIPLHIYPMLEALTNLICNDYDLISKHQTIENEDYEAVMTSQPLIDNNNTSLINRSQQSNSNSFIRSTPGRNIMLSISLISCCTLALLFRNSGISLIIITGGLIDSIFVFLIPALIHQKLISRSGESFFKHPIRLIFAILYIMATCGSLRTIFRKVCFHVIF